MNLGVEGAIQQRVLRLYQQALAQLPGVELGADVEALHQYRVNLRKGCSLLRLYRSLLAHTPASSLCLSLRAQCRVANRLRDLDVFHQQLPDGPLRDCIAGLRFEARTVLLSSLGELARERELCLALLTLTWSEQGQSFDQATVQVEHKVARQLEKKRQCAIRRQRSEDWHALRIMIKKQRYFSEQCLGEGKLSWQKAWQQRLGEFNDLCCQLEMLEQLEASVPTLADALQARQRQTRQALERQKAALVSLAETELHRH
ncbi:CHAD domain-containing protein [Ferrimonas marina]|uniref:CHAD domain-containing protein n=1 Tax=Ferrimonas marina TaxID=299255 RepID=A0A1M5Z3K8_9GAMM|nr:CHAD domain-containing protein [Ferrimonas marina]SHI18856.1 CHAD domain-containing protein [Ferrimonas marina]